MKAILKVSLLGLLAGGLSACGGSDGGTATDATQVTESVATPTLTASPTPSSSPTPASTTTSVEERIVLPDYSLYAPGDYFAYAAPWCSAYDSSIIVGQDIVDTISLLPSAFPNDVIISSSAPDHYPDSDLCGVYGYNYVAFGNYLTVNDAATMQPGRIRDIGTLTLSFDMSSAGSGEYNILTESFLTATPKDFSSRIEVGFFNHASADAIRHAGTGSSIGTYSDNAGRSWSVSRVEDFVMFVREDEDLLTGTLDIRDAFSFLTAHGVLTGDEWFNGIATGVEPRLGENVTTVSRWSVDYQ